MTSCETPFALSDSVEPELFVQFIPSTVEGNTVLRVQYTQPIAGDKHDSKYQESFIPDSVSLLVNGKSRKISGHDESWTCDWKVRMTDESFNEGDEIELYVSGGGAHPVSASTKVPPMPQVKDLQLVSANIADSTEIMRLTFSLQEDVSEGEYYGLQIREELTNITFYEDTAGVKADTLVLERYVSAGQLATAADLATLDLDAYAQISYVDGLITTISPTRPMMLLTDRLFEGNRYSCYIGSVDSREWAVIGDTTETQENKVIIDKQKYCRYKFYIYRLSDELFRYSKAQFLSYFNALSNFGLTPPNFTYTNVRGGMGVTGGIACYETDWIDVPIVNSL